MTLTLPLLCVQSVANFAASCHGVHQVLSLYCLGWMRRKTTFTPGMVLFVMPSNFCALQAGLRRSQSSDHPHTLKNKSLLASQEAEIAKALAVLLVAHFDPATLNRPRLRQCLSVFFPAYAAASSSHQHDLARAFRRAARGALGVAPIKKAPAPQLMRYMLQVIHQTSTNVSSSNLLSDEA